MLRRSRHRKFLRAITSVVHQLTRECGEQTISTFQTFFLAMSLHPDVREKAQAEIHRVVGPDRLPDHSDRSQLPYIDAIIKECLRWQNAVPLCIPHAVVEDDEYEGYFIPAGTVVFPNVWYGLYVCTPSPALPSHVQALCIKGRYYTIPKRTRSRNASVPSAS